MNPFPLQPAWPRTPLEVNDLFARQRDGDPLGVAVHRFMALYACFAAGLSTSIVEWSALPLLICFLVRMTGQHRILRPLWFDSVGLLTVAWAALLTLSMLYSAASGRDVLTDWQSIRYAGFVIALWPVLDIRAWLIRALIAGLLVGQGAQLLQFLQMTFDFRLLPIDRMPGRISGWWEPVVAGSLLCGALGLHLGATLFPPPRGRERGVGSLVPVTQASRDSAARRSSVARVIAFFGVLITLAGILATGTRGAWIGATLLLVFAFLLIMVRVAQASRLCMGDASPQRTSIMRGLLRPLALILLLTTLSLGAVALFAGQGLRDRYHRGVDEVRAALTEQNYATDTGLRIAMWKWAIAASRTHPLLGVGSGGYQPFVRSQTPESAATLGAPAQAIPLVHRHAHSWYLHTLAVTGLLGFATLFLLFVRAVVSGLRPPASPDGVLPNPHNLGPALALIGLACAGLFDPITVNAQTSYLFWILIALCLPSRPRDIANGAGA